MLVRQMAVKASLRTGYDHGAAADAEIADARIAGAQPQVRIRPADPTLRWSRQHEMVLLRAPAPAWTVFRATEDRNPGA